VNIKKKKKENFGRPETSHCNNFVNFVRRKVLEGQYVMQIDIFKTKINKIVLNFGSCPKYGHLQIILKI
jgi:hypothetical protein